MYLLHSSLRKIRIHVYTQSLFLSPYMCFFFSLSSFILHSLQHVLWFFFYCPLLSFFLRHCSPVYYFFSVFTAHHWASLSVCLPKLNPKFQLFIYRQLVRYSYPQSLPPPLSQHLFPMEHAFVHPLPQLSGWRLKTERGMQWWMKMNWLHHAKISWFFGWS